MPRTTHYQCYLAYCLLSTREHWPGRRLCPAHSRVAESPVAVWLGDEAVVGAVLKSSVNGVILKRAIYPPLNTWGHYDRAATVVSEYD